MASLVTAAMMMGPVRTLGQDLAIKTLTTTTSSIGSIISYLATNTKPGASDIMNTLTSLDLEFTIGIIEDVVKDYDAKDLNNVAINKALSGVHEILELIHKELNIIKGAIEYHNSKYFSGWRSFTWSGNLEAIKQYSVTLKNRYSMLFELLKIYC